MGIPRVRSGPFGNVYRLGGDGWQKAIRVFLFPSEDRGLRYRAISEHLQRARPRCLVGFEYQDDGIRVGGIWYPVLVMDWVEGITLDAWLDERIRALDRRSVRMQADAWVELVADLKAHRVAHGDLQHSNILVRLDDSTCLVDYDGLCVPSLVGRPSVDDGSRAYQHPGRVGRPLSLDLDDFSAWIIATSLRALAADPGLWETYVLRRGRNHILFCEEDLRQLGEARLWDALDRSPDAEVRRWSRLVRSAVGHGLDRVPGFPPSASGNRPVGPDPTVPAAPPVGLAERGRARVFVSHSTFDREVIEGEIIPLLNANGIDTWYSKDDIQTAARWERAILQGLKSCDWFMVVMSRRAAESEWVCDEVSWAMENRPGKIIPILLEDCDVRDFHIRLARIQYVDYRGDRRAARRRLLTVWEREPGAS
jgi:hypothetical protein